jgi:heme exporter protein B
VNRAPSIVSAALTIARKDLLIEFRTRSAFVSAVVFSIIGLATFFFAWPARVSPADAAAGVLWVVFVFSGLLGVQRSFTLEQTSRAIDGLVLAPIDREAVYLGKFLANILFVGAIQLVSVPAVAIFYNLEFSSALVMVFGIAVLATIGLASVGTLFSAMAVNTRMAELLLPLLSLPFFLPIVAPAAQATSNALEGLPLADSYRWLKLLAGFDIVFLTACTLAYPFTLDE